MKPQRWQRIRSVLDEALCHDSAQRQAFLEKTCDDAEMLHEARSLLMAIEEAGSFIEKPALAGVNGHPAPEALPEQTQPTKLGVYKIDRLLGQGGMGSVYLATRDDDVFQKQVALKVLKRGMDTTEIVRRFRSERQILANLTHGHIAQVHDGGSTPDGLPYLVMEHVEGTPIDLFCDREQLGIKARLELFRKVCDAVHFAHQNLVVHRDLKPANVLVTDAGEPKLLDFGIAKLLDAEGFPQTVEPTGPGTALMTPEYASPEQVLGQPVTTASDVYSLGIVLYELLTGHRPFYLESRQFEAVRQAVCEHEPDRPSTVVGKTVDVPSGGRLTPAAVSAARNADPRRLRRHLEGDLDNIVLKALRKDPRRRYTSAEQLADDLGRYLEGRPVRARPDTLAYRASKFLHRHRSAAAGVTLLALLALAFVVTLLIQHSRMVDQRDRAELTSELLTEVFALPDPIRTLGESVTAREILDRGAHRIEERLVGRPDVRSRLDATLGRTYLNLGLYPEARGHLEAAVTTLRQLEASDAGFADVLMLLAQVLAVEGDFQHAEERGREALALRRKLFGQRHPAVVASLVQLAHLDDRAGDFQRSRAGYQQALDLARQTGDAEALATTLDRFGQLLTHTGDDAEAEQLLEEALGIFRQLGGDEHPEVPTTMNNLALAVQGRDPARAEELLRKAMAVQRDRYHDIPPPLADSMENLALLLQQRGRYDEAERLYHETLSLKRQIYGTRHTEIAGALNNFARLHATRGRLKEAEEMYRQALSMQRPLLGEDHAGTALTLSNLGQVLERRGMLDQAEEMFTQSLEVTRRALGESNPRVGIVLTSLAGVEQTRGDLPSAEKRYVEAIEVLRKAGESAHLAGALHNLASMLRDSGRLEEARERFGEALVMNAEHFGGDHPEVAMIKASLALVEVSLGAHDRAEALARDAVDVFAGSLPADSPWTAAARRGLGLSLSAQRRWAEAEPLLIADFERLLELRGPHSDATHRAVNHLVELYDSWGRDDEADKYRRLATRNPP